MVLKQKRTISKRSWILLASGLLVLLLVGTGIVWFLNIDSSEEGSYNTTSEELSGEVEYSGVKASAVAENKTEGSQASTAKQTLPVGISFAGIVDNNVEVRAFISGIIEGNGTCIATFSKDGVEITESSPAFIDATTSQCEPIQIPKSRFTSSGVWTLVVSYSSTDAEGKSSAMEVDL